MLWVAQRVYIGVRVHPWPPFYPLPVSASIYAKAINSKVNMLSPVKQSPVV